MKRAASGFLLFVPAAVLLAWLLAYGWLLAGDRYQAYLAPVLRPLLIAALVMLALLFLAALRPIRPEQASRGRAALCVRSAVMLLPLLYLGATYGRTLGSYAAGMRSAGTSRTTNRISTLAYRLAQRRPGGQLTLAEILADLDRQVGHDVITEGMVYQDERVPAGYFALLRFVITCCAADAQPVAVLVAHPQAGSFPKDAWLRVEGELVLVRLASGEEEPCINAERITLIPAPRNPYVPSF